MVRPWMILCTYRLIAEIDRSKKAYHLRIDAGGGREMVAWFPKRFCEVRRYEVAGEKITDLLIEQWLAEKIGLDIKAG